MSKHKSYWIIFGSIFTISLLGYVIYSNIDKPVVLSDTDFTGFEEEIIPTPTPEPTESPIKNTNIELYNKLSNQFVSIEPKENSTLKIKAEDMRDLKKWLFITEARYRLLLSELSNFNQRVQVATESNRISNVDINILRNLTNNAESQIQSLAIDLDAFHNEVESIDSSYDLSTTLKNLGILTDQINNTINYTISSYQIISTE